MKTALCSIIPFENNGSDVPEWIPALPISDTIEGIDGRSWKLSNPQAFVDAYNSRPYKIPVDINHAIQRRGKNGDPSPAVSQGNELKIEGDQIWLRTPKWNQAGQSALNADEYAGISPVFDYDLDTGEIVRLLTVSLTNLPNFPDLALNDEELKEGVFMDEELKEELGLASDASKEQVLKLVKTLKQAANQSGTKTNIDTVPAEEHRSVVAKYNQALNDKGVLEEKLQLIEKQKRDSEVDAMIDEAVKAGKVSPAAREHYVALCDTDEGFESTKKIIELSEVKVNTQSMFAGKKPAENDIEIPEGIAMKGEDYVRIYKKNKIAQMNKGAVQ